MRLTVDELIAVLNAVTATTAGDMDGDEWTDEACAALDRAERKLQAELARREERQRSQHREQGQ